MSGLRAKTVWHEAPSAERLAAMLSDAVAARLKDAVARTGGAAIAVSGGTTPKRFFQALSAADLDWKNVTVTLVDERFVEEASPRSNARLVRDNLLRGKAAAARFEPLFRAQESIAEAAREASLALAELAWPLDVVVLGMGADGHTASFFPDAPDLDRILDPKAAGIVRVVDAPSAGEPRLTLALPRLASARFLALHIEGAAKRTVIDSVLDGTAHPPIASVLEHAGTPVEIFWAP